MSEEQRTCIVCKQPGGQRCAGCQSVYYCSRDHQRQHWKKHRPHCSAFRVETNALVGRRLLSTRDLQPGETILSQKPLAVGPKQITKPVCLTCCASVDGSYECSLCGWPLCGSACEKDARHVPECHLTLQERKEKIKICDFHEENLSYQSVMVLRCLHLRDDDPAKWKDLLNLQSHQEARKKLGFEDLDRQIIVKFIREFLKLGEKFSEELILQVCGIIAVNSHEIPFQGGMQAIYSTACLIEHDCVANATKTFTMDLEIVIRAAVPIPKSEKISISYTDPLWGTVNRQHHLTQTKFFRCQCLRCKDPSELNTFLSAVRCPSCREQGKDSGFLLLEDPIAENSRWRCNECGHTESAESNQSLMEKIGKDMLSVGTGGSKECQMFLKKFGNVLHPNHFYMTEVKLALCQMYGHEDGQVLHELDDETLESKEKICLDLLTIADQVVPGMTRLRALLLYELQAILAAKSRKLCVQGLMNKDDLRANVTVVKKMLHEAATIFSWEPEVLDEGRLAKLAAKELNDVDIFLRTLVN